MVILRSLLVVAMANLGMCNFKLLLLHTSDMHSRYDEVNIRTGRCQDETSERCYGGFARLRAEVDRLREEAKKQGTPTLYLDAGDVFGESVYFTEYSWRLALRMMNMLTPDVVSLGNHEFDLGVAPLANYVRYLQSPVVCSNIDTSKEPRMQNAGQSLLNPSVIFDFGGNKVAVIGYIKSRMSTLNIGDLKITDEIESLEKEARRLKVELKVKVVIALGHAGYYRDKEIAEKVDNIDVIVGGRTHYFLYSGKPLPSIEKPDGPYPTIVKKGKKKIPILHASFGTKYLGRIELEFNDKGELVKYTGQPILLKGDKKDPAILGALVPYKHDIRNKYHTFVGNTEVLLDGKDSICRFQECNIGNLITDAFVGVLNGRYKFTDEPKAVVAHAGFIHSGDINGSLYPKSDDDSGEIVLEDLMNILPFSRPLKLVQMKGSMLRDTLESAMKTYNPEKGGLFRACLMQVSGLRVQYDLTKPQGQRLTGVQIAPEYKEVVDEDYYNVVMPDFLANGGDGLYCITNLKTHPRSDLNEIDYVTLADYIKVYTPVKADPYKIQGRITITEPKTGKGWQSISKFIKSIRDRIKVLLGRLNVFKKG